jgi:hypothetical protein
MDSHTSPSVSSFLPSAIILALIGWGGLFVLVNYTIPTVGPRWLFFFLSVLAITGTSLPAVAFLNRRFPTSPPATNGAVFREAIWIGIFFPTLVWLQFGRVLTYALIILLAAGLIGIELLLRIRERSQWKP